MLYWPSRWYPLLPLLLGVAFFVGVPVPVSGDDTGNATRHIIKDAVELGAVCLDGSPGLYYLRDATTPAGATKWHLHFEGGAWCTSLDSGTDWKPTCAFDSCESRALTNKHGSSNTPYDMEFLPFHTALFAGDLKSYASNDCSRNPTLCEFNFVLVRYCDGGGWQGDVDEPMVTELNNTIYFRGNRIMYAILKELLADHDMIGATEIVLSGNSAGGGAVVVMIDEIRDYIYNSVDDDGSADASAYPLVVGLVDSGLFAPSFSDVGPQGAMAENMHWTMTTNEILPHLNSACREANAHKSEEEQMLECGLPGLAIAYVESPLFVLQSLYDALNLVCLLEVYTAFPGNEAKMSAEDNATIDQFVSDYMERVVAPLLMSEDASLSHPLRMGADHQNVALWLNSCPHHGMLMQYAFPPKFTLIKFWERVGVDGQSAATAFDAWYTLVKASSAEPPATSFEAKIDLQPGVCFACCDSAIDPGAAGAGFAKAPPLTQLGFDSSYAYETPFQWGFRRQEEKVEVEVEEKVKVAEEPDAKEKGVMSAWLQSSDHLLLWFVSAIAVSCVVGFCMSAGSTALFDYGRGYARVRVDGQNKYAFADSSQTTTTTENDDEVRQLNQV